MVAPHGSRKPKLAYKLWHAMHARCYNKDHVGYGYYGPRSIGVCERWHSFENFRDDIGDRPKGMSLDRIDNDKGYEPGNVRWADHTTQMRNRRSSKVTAEIAEQVRLLRADGVPNCVVARQFKISPATVCDIVAGRTWARDTHVQSIC